MKILTGLYTLYAYIIFLFLCLIFVPILTFLCHRVSWHPLALWLHKVWAWLLFILLFIRVQVERRHTLQPGHRYIYCANHFSYLDIPAMYLFARAKFIGKSSLGDVPVFGYFFRKIHIAVNRSSFRSRAESLKKAREAMSQGFNVAVFPEGGVLVKQENLPQMVSFRDGAFRLSAENNIPILPVTMPYNYLLVPDGEPLRLHPHICKLIIHDPVYPRGASDEDIKWLRDEVFKVIQGELLAHHPDKINSVG